MPLADTALQRRRNVGTIPAKMPAPAGIFIAATV